MNENDEGTTTGKLLKGRIPRHGLPLKNGRTVLSGLLFLAFGVVLTLHGLGVLEIGSEGKRSVGLVSLGGVIAFAGLAECRSGVMGIRERRRRRRVAGEQLGQPWFADHLWDTTGVIGPAARQLLIPLPLAVCFFLFLFPLNWVFFSLGRLDWLVTAILAVLNSILLVSSGWAFRNLRHYLKLRTLALHFKGFPFFLGERLKAQLHLPKNARESVSTTLTLRCIEVRIEPDNHGQKVRRRYETYAETQHIDACGDDLVIPIAFDLPADATPTALSGCPPVYWEIELDAEVTGFDYVPRFLVPVYARPDD